MTSINFNGPNYGSYNKSTQGNRPSPEQFMNQVGDEGFSQAEFQGGPPPGPPPGANGGQGMDPQQAAAMQQHRQLVDQAFSQYGLNGKDIFNEVKNASGSNQPLPPDQMDSALSTVLQNHGLNDTQITSLLNTIRPNNDSQ